jgi:hypothetical protein
MERDEGQPEEYPRGRGYGHDYMRGGEVFGGYGYASRDEYRRPRGASDESGAETDGEDSLEGDLMADAALAHWNNVSLNTPPSTDGAAQPAGEDTGPPVPQIEHTYGDPGGNRAHSRSYYVTQAQLQQRIYRAKGA